MAGYPKGKMAVKITEGMGRDVFSAPQAAMDDLDFNLSRNRKTGALAATTNSEDGTVHTQHEDRPGGLIFLNFVVENGQASLGDPGEHCFLSRDVINRLSQTMQSVLTHNRSQT